MDRFDRLWHWVVERTALWIAGGLVLVAAVVLLTVEPNPGTRSLANGLIALTILAAILVGLDALSGRTDPHDESFAPAPWSDSGGIADGRPEEAEDRYPLSGEELAPAIDRAGRVARHRGTVAAGLADLRPTLRPALAAVLIRGGMDESDAERAIDEGTWTDDRAAAATLSADVVRPDWELRERVRAWLFPERIVRREARRAVHEIGRAAEAQVPTVPGRSAPRTVPVVQPGLAELRRGADGELQDVVEPLADPGAVGDAEGEGSDVDRDGRDDERHDEEGAQDPGPGDVTGDGHPSGRRSAEGQR